MTHHHHPSYCTPAEADISNSWCRRKQYDSRRGPLKQQLPPASHYKVPCDRCASWVIPIPATFCWRCWSDQYIL